MPDHVTASRAGTLPAIVALLLGALAIATAPLFVKVSEAGPVATAFWRVCLALPFLWSWSFIAARRAVHSAHTRQRALLVVAGLFFAADLGVWHWSIILTSVANSTLLANLAPIFVALASWLLFKQRLSNAFLLGLAVALAGMVPLVGADFTMGGKEFAGDALGLLTAVFYGGYQLAVTRLRARVPTPVVMAWSSSITALALLPVMLLSGEHILPLSVNGWLVVAGLAIVAQVVGQSLIAYAMAHLPATFASVGLLFQPVMSAVFAWLLLNEGMTVLQIAGAITVLAGIFIVRRAEAAR